MHETYENTMKTKTTIENKIIEIKETIKTIKNDITAEIKNQERITKEIEATSKQTIINQNALAKQLLEFNNQYDPNSIINSLKGGMKKEIIQLYNDKKVGNKQIGFENETVLKKINKNIEDFFNIQEENDTTKITVIQQQNYNIKIILEFAIQAINKILHIIFTNYNEENNDKITIIINKFDKFIEQIIKGNNEIDENKKLLKKINIDKLKEKLAINKKELEQNEKEIKQLVEQIKNLDTEGIKLKQKSRMKYQKYKQKYIKLKAKLDKYNMLNKN
jgi:hypothetical protein